MDTLVYFFLGLMVYLFLGIINLLFAVFYNQKFIKVLRSTVLTLELVRTKFNKSPTVKKQLVKEKQLTKVDTFFETEKYQAALSDAVNAERIEKKQEMEVTVQSGQILAPLLSKWEITKNMWTLVANWIFVVLLIVVSKIFGYLYLSPKERQELE